MRSNPKKGPAPPTAAEAKDAAFVALAAAPTAAAAAAVDKVGAKAAALEPLGLRLEGNFGPLASLGPRPRARVLVVVALPRSGGTTYVTMLAQVCEVPLGRDAQRTITLDAAVEDVEECAGFTSVALSSSKHPPFACFVRLQPRCPLPHKQ